MHACPRADSPVCSQSKRLGQPISKPTGADLFYASSGAASMIKPGPDDRVYPVFKLATVIDALAEERIPAQDALAGVRLSREALASPTARVSLNQVLECCRNAARLSRDPHIGYRAGLRFHLAAYGMYGFAL